MAKTKHISFFKKRLKIKLNRGKNAKSSFVSEINKLIKKYSYKNEQLSKELWVIKTIYEVQNIYLDSFSLIKEKDYYKAWCELEKCEIALLSLLKHYVPSNTDEYKISFIEKSVENWQGVFPYTLFSSPEILEKRVECNICGEVKSPRSKCKHKEGEIYGGEICLGIVTDMEIISFSAVTNPVHKYCVYFAVDDETGERKNDHDYSLIDYIIERLESPLDGWSYKKRTIRYNKSQIKDYALTNPCPCQSGSEYMKCCYLKGYVDAPHTEVKFEKAIPREMHKFVRGF